MVLKLKLELIFLVIIFLYIIYRSIKNKRLTVRYSILWMFVVIVLFLLAIFSEPLFIFANLLGIEKLSNLVFLVIIGLLLFLTFNLTTIISSHKKRIINLTQEFGIFDNEKRNDNEEKN